MPIPAGAQEFWRVPPATDLSCVQCHPPHSATLKPNCIHILQLSPWDLRSIFHTHLKSHNTLSIVRETRELPKIAGFCRDREQAIQTNPAALGQKELVPVRPEMGFCGGKNSELYQTYSELPHDRLHRLSEDFAQTMSFQNLPLSKLPVEF